MKKIFTACCMIIAVALVCTAFTSCGKDKNKDEKESTTENTTSGIFATVGDSVFFARVKDDGVEILKDDDVYQTLKFQQNDSQPFDAEYAASHFEFVDMNFDGQPDFYVATANDGEYTYYYCWLYNATTKQFDYSVSLSALKNITVDAENQRILTTAKKDGQTLVVSYRWVNGELLYDTDYETEKVSDTIKSNILGTENSKQDASSSKSDDKSTNSATVSNKTTERDSAKTTVGGSVQNTPAQTTQKRPMNTTTTSPAVGNNVVLNTDSDIDENWF